LHTSTFNQFLAYEVARGGFLDRHVRLIRQVYRRRRDVMLKAMESDFPKGVHWTKPKGGLFLWGVLPEGMKSVEVLRSAVEQKVAFVPGGPFFPRGGGENTMRLNFSFASEDRIQEGIRRLGNVLAERVGRKPAV
jgi:2-aminoadipate transaminase